MQSGYRIAALECKWRITTDMHQVRKRTIDKWNLAILAGLLFAIIFKVYKINSIPDGYHIDELGSVYDAWSLLHFGVDRWQTSWPVHFQNFGSGQNALYTYMLVPLFGLFGLSKAVIRTPSLIGSFLFLFSGIGIISLAWPDRTENRTGEKIAILLYVLLYGISPYTQLSGRLGLESLLMLGFSSVSVLFFLLAAEKRKTCLWILDGFLWGLTLYTYAISYIAVPVFLLFAGVILIRHRRVTFSQILLFAIPLAVLAFPLILEQYINIFDKKPFSIGPFSLTRLKYYRSGDLTLSNIPNNLFLTLKSMLFYDDLDYNTIERYWTFFPISVPFFGIGLIWHIRMLIKRQNNGMEPSFVILLWFFVMLGIGCILGTKDNQVGASPNTNKINGIILSTMFYIVLGLYVTFRDLNYVRIKKYAAMVVLLIYLGYGASFIRYYVKYFQPKQYWYYLYPETVKLIEENEVLSQKPVFTKEHSICYLVSSLHSPDEIANGAGKNWKHLAWQDPEELVNEYGTGATYLFLDLPHELYESLLSMGFQVFEEGKHTTFYYLEAEN